MMYRSILILFSIFNFCLSSLDAQQLVVYSRGQVNFRLSAGDEINYVTRHSKKQKSDVIRSLQKDTLFLSRDTVSVFLIARIGTSNGEKKDIWRDRGQKVFIAGVLLGLGDYITVTAVQNKSYEPNRGVIIVSTALITAGIVMMLAPGTVRINRRNKVLIINPDNVKQ